ncbi:MAG: GNAT family N-acetyltransferase [Rhodospirillales bacterium]|nr:GNAT family N-acetyltransferase [Rhodospirillales bacterium]
MSNKTNGEEYLFELDELVIRRASAGDMSAVVDIDQLNTGITKPEYWKDTFVRFGSRSDRFFLVAEDSGEVIAFIIGEMRAWEFGSPPCGWIFAMGVNPNARLKKVGSHMFNVMCECLNKAGADKVRTMLARDDNLNMAFFRSQGMMGGPFIELEMPLD